ncbi:MAG: transcriptional activator RfaH, partial [Gammaproteobacteria bacterium]|nr:transcriptional activator RfaH [Gammaproteobacteria bacterium]
MSSWYLLQCKPREETRASENLENQGFTTFLPEISIAKKTKVGFTETEAPLFPGYLFIKLNNEVDNCAPIRSTRGVNKLVSFGQTAAVV